MTGRGACGSGTTVAGRGVCSSGTAVAGRGVCGTAAGGSTVRQDWEGSWGSRGVGSWDRLGTGCWDSGSGARGSGRGARDSGSGARDTEGVTGDTGGEAGDTGGEGQEAGPDGQDGSRGSRLSSPNAGLAMSTALGVPRPLRGTECGTPGCTQDAPGSLRETVQPSSCIGPIRGVVKWFPPWVQGLPLGGSGS